MEKTRYCPKISFVTMVLIVLLLMTAQVALAALSQPGPPVTEPVEVHGNVNVTGTVAVEEPVDVTGTVSIQQPVDVNILGTVPVEGDVSINGPVSIDGTVPVEGSVQITNPVAVQGTVPVDVQGPVEVQGSVNAIIQEPLVVVNQSAPAQQPVQWGGQGTFSEREDGLWTSNIHLGTVPPGKRFVLEHVSARSETGIPESGANGRIRGIHSADGTEYDAQLYFMFTKDERFSLTTTNFSARYYVEENDELVIGVLSFPDPDAGEDTKFQASVIGYFVDM